MLNRDLLDLYTDYLISSFSLTTATGLSSLLDNRISHDKITRFLSNASYTQKDYWFLIKPLVRQVENPQGILIVDDTLEEKPHTDENDIVCYHYDHTKGRSVKGINLVNFVYHTHLPQDDQDIVVPLSFEVISKTEEYLDKKTKKVKRKSKITKNEILRNRLQTITYQNCVKYQYVIFDVWYVSKENMEYIKGDLKKDFICPIKTNRLVARSLDDKLQGTFVPVSQLEIKPNESILVYLKGLDFQLLLTKQVFKNKDGSIGVLFLVSSDTSLNSLESETIYQKRWKVEEFHKSLKQNVALEKSPTKIERTQKNHIFACMIAFIKLEQLKIKTNKNHFALKRKLYLKAIKTAFDQLNHLKNNNELIPIGFA